MSGTRRQMMKRYGRHIAAKKKNVPDDPSVAMHQGVNCPIMNVPTQSERPAIDIATPRSPVLSRRLASRGRCSIRGSANFATRRLQPPLRHDGSRKSPSDCARQNYRFAPSQHRADSRIQTTSRTCSSASTECPCVNGAPRKGLSMDGNGVGV